MTEPWKNNSIFFFILHTFPKASKRFEAFCPNRSVFFVEPSLFSAMKKKKKAVATADTVVSNLDLFLQKAIFNAPDKTYFIKNINVGLSKQSVVFV